MINAVCLTETYFSNEDVAPDSGQVMSALRTIESVLRSVDTTKMSQ